MTIQFHLTDVEFRLLDLLRHGKSQYGHKCEEPGGPSYLNVTDPDLKKMIQENWIEFENGWWDLSFLGRAKSIALRDQETARGKKK